MSFAYNGMESRQKKKMKEKLSFMIPSTSSGKDKISIKHIYSGYYLVLYLQGELTIIHLLISFYGNCNYMNI